MQDLVKRAATAKDPSDSASISLAESDPEAWWKSFGDGEELDYSNLLELLAPSTGTRRDLLSGYFEAGEDELESGLKIPTAAHKAIAQLVRRGSIRVIITTNFDRLIEHALDEAGVSHQVIHRADQIAAMSPLTHANATVIKVHGDYFDLDMRNTIEELSAYPEDLAALVDRVFDEYGLIISGWSADWDKALVQALEKRGSRRYPLYWDSRSSKGENAKRLIAQHSGKVISASSADELFSGLIERVEALEKLAEPPVTTAIAVARLKRYLPEPARRIDAHDLVMQTSERLAQYIAEKPLYAQTFDYQDLQDLYEGYLEASRPLLTLLTVGVWHDGDGRYTALWQDALQRLLDARVAPDGVFTEVLSGAQHYPALLAMEAMGLAALGRGRDRTLLNLATEANWHSPYSPRNSFSPAAQVLHVHRILGHDTSNSLPRWKGTRWIYPASHMLREDLRDIVRDLIPDDARYKMVFDSLEYELGLIQEHTQDAYSAYRANPGEFLGEGQWLPGGEVSAEVTFRKTADREAWRALLGDGDDFDTQLVEFREVLKSMQRWG
jgi:hypothetical protein